MHKRWPTDIETRWNRGEVQGPTTSSETDKPCNSQCYRFYSLLVWCTTEDVKDESSPRTVKRGKKKPLSFSTLVQTNFGPVSSLLVVYTYPMLPWMVSLGLKPLRDFQT